MWAKTVKTVQSNSKWTSRFPVADNNVVDQLVDPPPRIINIDWKAKNFQNLEYNELHEDSEDTMTYDNYNVTQKSQIKLNDNFDNTNLSKSQLEAQMKLVIERMNLFLDTISHKNESSALVPEDECKTERDLVQKLKQLNNRISQFN